MSLQESQEFDFPPGLSSRNRGTDLSDRDQLLQQRFTNEHALAVYGDRKQSQQIPSYGGLQRQLGHLDRDIGFGDAMLHQPNRNNASSSLQSSAALSRPTYSLSNNTLPNSSINSVSGNHNPNSNNNISSSSSSHNNNNTQQQRSSLSSSPPTVGQLYSSSSPVDSQIFRPQTQTPSASATNATRSTLWWGEIEPWMDEEYVKQVCNIMGWDPVSIKVPHPGPDQQANNHGYCFLTFPTPAHAAAVLTQIHHAQKNGGAAATMPNSSKPFVLNWATNIAASTSPSASIPSPSYQSSNSFQGQGGAYVQPQQYQKEYSIFVGDLAPETSNSDLVAVFRNPVLGLRNDREPKLIRPFLSCKSAKIMLDPVTGVSRGYGFVRFTDEADQQRALIEMHGLYCLSRPMRISPATAKFKPAPSLPSTIPFPSSDGPITLALPLPNSLQTKSVSAPIAASSSNGSLGTGQNGGGISMSGSAGASSSGGALSGSNSNSNLSTYGQPTSLSADDLLTLPNHVLQQIAQQYANSDAGAKFAASVGATSSSSSATSPYAVESAGLSQAALSRMNGATEGGVPPRYAINDESWKHHAQARAILGNLIGPNGEQLTSTDPYNTTVFVGGLSPLISEETLRTFFAPFGDIHYVKVPVGKHCGFVQFVRKADAERAIERMQGFPVGGSRIRLSWGRSQYKAAQAAAQAAQAAQAAALQSSQYTVPTPPLLNEQAIQILQRMGYLNGDIHGLNDLNMPIAEQVSNAIYGTNSSNSSTHAHVNSDPFASYTMQPQSRADMLRNQSSAFSPFDNNLVNLNMLPVADTRRRDSAPLLRPETFTQQQYQSAAKYSGGFTVQTQDLKPASNANGTGGNRPSPTSTRPPSASRYTYLDHASASIPASGHQRNGSHQQQHLHGEDGQDYDALHDLNGTLASLDLDRDRNASSAMNAGNATASFRRTPSPRG